MLSLVGIRPHGVGGTILAIGVNHRNAAELLRERLQGDEADIARLLQDARARGLDQAMAAATRDRCEFWCVAEDAQKARAAALGALGEAADLDAGALHAIAIDLRGPAALRHIFAVTASLEARLPGQSETLEEIRALHELARRLGALGPELEKVMKAAFEAALAARGGHAGSMAASAVGILRRLHGDVGDLSALLIGDGELGESIHKQMSAIGVERWTILHPQERRARQWAEGHRRHWRPFGELAEALAGADLVVSALEQGQQTISAAMVEAALRKRKRRPMLLIDLAIPGDIDEGVDAVEDAYLFSIEDLERLARDADRPMADALGSRRRSVELAALRFAAEGAGDHDALIEALRQRFEAERQDILRQGVSDPAEATEQLAERMLRQLADGVKGGGALAEAIEQIFGLKDRNGPRES